MGSREDHVCGSHRVSAGEGRRKGVVSGSQRRIRTSFAKLKRRICRFNYCAIILFETMSISGYRRNQKLYSMRRRTEFRQPTNEFNCIKIEFKKVIGKIFETVPYKNIYIMKSCIANFLYFHHHEKSLFSLKTVLYIFNVCITITQSMKYESIDM